MKSFLSVSFADARKSPSLATLADLSEPRHRSADIRDEHALSRDVLERIYIGRRLKKPTERGKPFDFHPVLARAKAA